MTQILRAARVLGANKDLTMEMARKGCRFLASTDFDRTPPEISADLYQLLAEESGNYDPYYYLKRANITRALELYPELKKLVDSSPDPLRTALEISLAGNVIDFGANSEEDWLSDGKFLRLGKLAADDYLLLVEDLRQAKNIVFLGDNAGETVFDRLLIEKIGKRVVYAVREKPIINDATVEEGRLSKLDEVAEIVSSGCSAPGTVLTGCSSEFINLLAGADLIISKGQGNFECLEEVKGPFYFLLKAKCEVVSRRLGVLEGSLILSRTTNFSPKLLT
jgi:hypothetical protein